MTALVARHEAAGHEPVPETARGLLGFVRERNGQTGTVPVLHQRIAAPLRAAGDGFAEGQDVKARLCEMFPHRPVPTLATGGRPDPNLEAGNRAARRGRAPAPCAAARRRLPPPEIPATDPAPVPGMTYLKSPACGAC
ncbi:MAG: hypothetical protein KDK53_09450 [Maritimibacter sp.]|nr:hypothetical protein [Maritimibacter sp.]